MKIGISILFLAVTVIFSACGNKNNTTEKSTKDTSLQPVDTSNVSGKDSKIDDVVASYLSLKNALANDNGNDAANAAKSINERLAKIDGSLSPEKKKIFDEVKDDIKEHAEHISTNSSDIKHQREHFDLLSKDIIDLVKAAGSSQSLYLDFCPMYNNKKGASWLSETKEISNPYYGKEMPKCGEVKEEIKPKE